MTQWLRQFQILLKRAEHQFLDKVNLNLEPGFLLLSCFVPTLIFIVMLWMMMNQGGQGRGGGMMNFGKSHVKPQDPSKNKVRFSDVAGEEEEKQELVEIVEFLKNPAKYTKLGARIPAGVLLEGPPGTGKTLLARAVAGEAGVPFYSISGSEIDAVGRRRGTGMGGGNDEREQTLNQILIEMDGFEGSEGVIILASTNRSDVLDPALLRSGRFDRKILVGAPDVKGREAILNVHARNKPLAKNVDLKAIAQQTPGYVGADLENLLNEAALLAARRNKKEIDAADIDEAEDRIFQGPAKTNRGMSEQERRTTAYHEAGHALVGLVRSEASVVRKVTIVPRGRIGGYALMTPKNDRYNLRYSEAKEQLAGLLVLGILFSNGLGGDMAGNIAYYVLSPLNFIVFLFPANKINIAVYVIILLKLGLMSGTFTWLILKWFNF